MLRKLLLRHANKPAAMPNSFAYMYIYRVRHTFTPLISLYLVSKLMFTVAILAIPHVAQPVR
jgi:hypothetical protein